MAQPKNPSITPIERQSLTTFYRSTQGDHWRAREAWLSNNVTPCQWQGVTCAHGHVTALDLRENGLGGPLPPAMGHLAYLERIDLAGNHLRGPLPQSLGQLRYLRHLDLAHNHLRGPLPGGLRLLTRLEVLDLRDNALNGEIPPALGELARLRRLDLADNRLTGEVPEELGRLALLTHLGLSGNPLRGPLPRSLAKLLALETLTFAGTDLWERGEADFQDWLAGIPHVTRSGITDAALKRELRARLTVLSGAGVAGAALAVLLTPLLGLLPGLAAALAGSAGTAGALSGLRRLAPGRSSPGDPHRATEARIREALAAQTAAARGRLPPDLHAQLEDVSQAVLALLPRIDNLDSGARDIYVVRQTALAYLPRILEYYLALPPDYARSHPLRGGKTAHDLLAEQLSLLERELHAIAGRVNRDRAWQLMVQGRFLRDRFEEPPDALRK